MTEVSRVRFVRRAAIRNPDLANEDLARLQMQRANFLITPQDFLKATQVVVDSGYELEHPEAWRLIGCGLAEPANETATRLAKAHGWLDKLDRIHEAGEQIELGRGTGDTKYDISEAAGKRRLEAFFAKRGNLGETYEPELLHDPDAPAGHVDGPPEPDSQ